MKMTFETWKNLPEAERKQKCQDLNPYEELDVFKAVESAFIAEFGNQPGIDKTHCGLGPCMGPFNSIVVHINRGQPRTKLPKYFLGFPVLREYKKK